MLIKGPLLPFLKTEKDLKESIKTIDEIVYEIIDKRLEIIKENKDFYKEDILGFYMSNLDENNKPFSRKYLRDVIINFIFAGNIFFFSF